MTRGLIKQHQRIVLLLLMNVLFFPQAFALNGYFSHGYGSISKAMGGAGVAFGQDALTNASNPANLIFVQDQLNAGMALFSPPRRYNVSSSSLNGAGGSFTLDAGTQRSNRNYFFIPHFGYTRRLNEQRTVGFSLYGNGGLNTDYSKGSALFDPDGIGPVTVSSSSGTFGAGSTGADLNQLFLNFSLAQQVNDTVTHGASLLFATQAIQLRGLNAFAPLTKTFVASNGTQQPDHLSNNGRDFSFGVGLRLGTNIRVSPQWYLGAAYRTKTYMTRFDKYEDVLADDGNFDIPANMSIGVAYLPSPEWLFVMDVQRIWYSDVDAVGNDLNNIFACPGAGQVGNDLESCFGGKDGAGFGWDDQTILKLGLQWKASPRLTMRAGYSHATNPVDRENVLINILAPGILREHFTAGATYTFNQNKAINFAVFYLPNEKLKGPNAFDPTQTIELEHEEFELELSYSRHF